MRDRRHRSIARRNKTVLFIMVIFDDLHKLLLYQRLNLGYECHICKKKFLNRLDHLQHTSSCKEQIKCPTCGKTFAHLQILHLHMQFHYLSQPEKCQTKEECVDVIRPDGHDNSSQENIPDQETRTSDIGSVLGNPMHNDTSKDGQEDIIIKENNEQIPTIDITETYSPKKRSSHKNKLKNRSRAVKKNIGLTKIKMEDCLRCDDCSCIYIDEKDYYKHMRNFHQLDVNNIPIIRQNSRTKRNCRSCCKQCRGINCSPVKRPRATQSASNLIFKINMADNIKNRWSKMVSSQISELTIPSSKVAEIKPDPDSVTIKTELEDTPDLSHLLSQVEVKIKTEPVDEYSY